MSSAVAATWSASVRPPSSVIVCLSVGVGLLVEQSPGTARTQGSRAPSVLSRRSSDECIHRLNLGGGQSDRGSGCRNGGSPVGRAFRQWRGSVHRSEEHTSELQS